MGLNHLMVRPVLLILLIISFMFMPFSRTNASALGNRSLEISNAQSDASGVTYKLSFTSNAAYNIGSVKILFCSNSPVVYDSCIPPLGFNSNSITISALGNAGITDFYLNPAPANSVLLSRPSTQILTPTQVSLTLNGFHNPSETGTFYARVYLYSSTDTSGAYLDAGGFALSTTADVTLSSTVPPFLYFCAGLSFNGYDCSTGSGFSNDFGTLSTNKTSTATSQFIIGTNAAYGINVAAEGTTLTSGNNVITGLTTPSASQAGIPQFGFNLRANTNPSVGQDPVGPGVANISSNYNTVNLFKFINGDSIVHTTGVVDAEKFTSSYIVNIGPNTSPGFYTTTITYICLGNF